MTTHTTKTLLDGCRAGCDAAFTMLAFGNDWRSEWHALQGRRIERDRDAVHRFREVIANAKEWGMFGDAAQRVLHDYAVASVSIWQDAGELCLRAQFEGAAAMSNWLREYQTDWLSDWSKLMRVDETSMPWREWMGALERGMTEIVRPDGIGAMSARRRAGANATHEAVHAK
ncbi:hypothetical protein [Burkholderia stagnalis]|uniref:hypothetical protein n=1 Tax=Burkholderia stagnalis TaxID=1503054 RepID=UPI0012DA8080|nr:hypothetical protein [Burkholderia stagnalis]